MESPDDGPTPTSLIATLASSAVYATATLLGPQEGVGAGVNETSGGDVPILEPDPMDDGNYVLNTIVGILIVVSASALNAFGLNVTKMDHVRTLALPRRERKEEYLRPLWLAGMGMYIVSQVFGSTLALRWLRPDWVAPLGSTSLIFNFLFAKWLVGTPVTATDIRGTAVIILGVILILVFSSINHGLQQGLNVERLKALWTRSAWLAHFVFLILFTASTYFVSSLFARLLASRASYSPLASPSLPTTSRRDRPSNAVVAFVKARWAQWKGIEDTALRYLEKILQRADDARITWLQGVGWAVAGGSLAGACLVFTKAFVKLLGLPGHPFLNVASIMTVLLTIFTAVLQIVCLNRALVCVDTVIVVPLFYAGYTVFGFVNSLIFYDEAGQYARWVLIAVFLSIAVLVAGVTILSLKSSAKNASDPYTSASGGERGDTISTEAEGSMRMNPRQRMPRGQEYSAGADGIQGLGISGAAGAGVGGEAAGSGSRKPGAPYRSLSGTSNGGTFGAGNGEGEVMWEVGSVSSDEDEDDEQDTANRVKGAREGEGNVSGKKEGPGIEAGQGAANEGDSRRGLGVPGAKGERRGLLFDEDDDDADADILGSGGGSGETTEQARERRELREAERNPFEDEEQDDGGGPTRAAGRDRNGAGDEEGFGDFERAK